MSQSASHTAAQYERMPEVQRFQGFLRIPSITQTGTKGSYRQAVDYLRGLLKDNFQLKEVEYVPNKPVLIATRVGEDPSLPSIMLNSHYDVVPCVLDKWHYDPFGATLLENGDIVARGTQDMKCVVMQYVEAMNRLISEKVKLKRTVHLTFVPDEEIGGTDGMGYFVDSPEFAALNVGCSLDEGLANDDMKSEKFTVFYGERAVWWLQVRAEGPTGHGSRFIENTAMEKLINSVNKFLAFREEQRRKLHEGCNHAVAIKLGDVVTINLTALQGGVSADGKNFALNVIPPNAMAGFDVRIPPHVPLEEIEAKIKEWTQGMTYEFTYKTPAHAVSSTDRATNPYWAAFEDTVKATGVELVKEIFPAGTDGRYVRYKNVPVFGFSPISRTPILLHDHDERLNAGVYLRGIDVYAKVIPALANV